MLDRLIITTDKDWTPASTRPAPMRVCLTAETVLSAAQEVATAAFASAVAAPVRGTGSYDEPWWLDGSPLTWMRVAQRMRHHLGEQRYVWVCGRWVVKNPGYYMADAGGFEQTSSQIAFDGTHGMRTRGGASYREYANAMSAQARQSARKLPVADRPGHAVVWSQHKAAKLRAVLKNDPEYATLLATKGHGTTGQILPVLAATLFLAEPARNPRAFLSNLVLLDFLQHGITYGGRKEGARPKHYTLDRALFRSEDKGGMQAHERGGKLSPANTDSAKKGIAQHIDLAEYYSQRKEATLLIRYVANGLLGVGTDASAVGGIPVAPYQAGLPEADVTQVEDAAAVGLPAFRKAAIGYLKYHFRARITSFNG